MDGSRQTFGAVPTRAPIAPLACTTAQAGAAAHGGHPGGIHSIDDKLIEAEAKGLRRAARPRRSDDDGRAER